MAIEHKDIADPNRHEPKGISTALANTNYVANGSGSGAWSKIPVQGLEGITSNGVSGQVVTVDGSGLFGFKWVVARGYTSFLNIASPTTITFPTTYAKINVTTTASGAPVEATEGTNARITYTGATARRGVIEASVNLGHSIGADRDLRIAIFKNGALVPQSEVVITSPTVHKNQLHTFVESTLATNDYFEVFVKNDGASGDVVIYSLKLSLVGY